MAQAGYTANPATFEHKQGFLDVFRGFDGGDLDAGFAGGDAAGDGGPGLHSNVPGSPMPALPVLPAVMGSARGPQPSDQHQFIQVVFPWAVDIDSVFDLLAAGNSFLGDSAVGAGDNVVRVLPPLNVQESEISEAIARLSRVLAGVAKSAA